MRVVEIANFRSIFIYLLTFSVCSGAFSEDAVSSLLDKGRLSVQTIVGETVSDVGGRYGELHRICLEPKCSYNMIPFAPGGDVGGIVSSASVGTQKSSESCFIYSDDVLGFKFDIAAGSIGSTLGSNTNELLVSCGRRSSYAFSIFGGDTTEGNRIETMLVTLVSGDGRETEAYIALLVDGVRPKAMLFDENDTFQHHTIELILTPSSQTDFGILRGAFKVVGLAIGVYLL